MEIDLTQLDDLYKADLSPIKEAGDSKVSKDKLNNHSKPTEDTQDNKKDIEGEDKPKQYLIINREKEAHEKAIGVYKEYQENIKKSETLRSSILHDIKLGQDPYNLLLKAIECISLMTGNPHYYKQAKDDLQAIYGVLGYKAPAEQEVQEVQTRLNNLIKALDRETDINSKERIKKAIKAHKERQDQLLKLIS